MGGLALGKMNWYTGENRSMEVVGMSDQSKVMFLPGETLKERLKKAAHVTPSAEQMRWMDKELTIFLHFGMNTFNGRQWGNGTEKLSDYAPTALDPEQWVRICAEAGFKHIITTLKHHDGFCLWHTDSTDFSVKNTEYTMDVAQELSAACRKYGVGFGVYLSPWDMHQREAGIWPTERYNDLFMQQLEELLTHYGPVEELWFDGACGDHPIWQKVPCYQTDQWYEMIHRLQPSAVYRMYDPYFFTDEEGWRQLQEGKGQIKWSGKAVRWVGNEEGRSRADEWSVQPVSERMIAQNAVWPDLGDIKYYEHAVGAVWYPVEVNTTILNQWFWNPETSKVKSLDRLIETYYQSVGNNGVLLLNLSPDRTGRVPEDQVRRLMELRKFIDATFCRNLAEDACVTVMQSGKAEDAAVILTEDQDEFWEARSDWDLEKDTISFEIILPEKREFDQVMVREHVQEGQRVAEWSFSVWEDGAYHEVVRKGAVGRKSIRRFQTVCTDKVRLTIHKSYDTPLISGFGLYLTQKPESEEQEHVMDLSALVAAELPDDAVTGVSYRLFRGGRQSAAQIDPDVEKHGESGHLPALDPRYLDRRSDYHAEFTGWLEVLESGTYRFELSSVDGAMLCLAGQLCVDNDEPHAWRGVSRTLRLDQGYYPYRLLYTSFRGEAAFTLDPDADCENLENKRVRFL